MRDGYAMACRMCVLLGTCPEGQPHRRCFPEQRYVKFRTRQLRGLLLKQGHDRVTVAGQEPSILHVVYNELRCYRAMRKIGEEGEYEKASHGRDVPTETARYLTELQKRHETSLEKLGLTPASILRLKQTKPDNLLQWANAIQDAKTQRALKAEAVDAEFTAEDTPKGEGVPGAEGDV